jgi:hypothetical protein
VPQARQAGAGQRLVQRVYAAQQGPAQQHGGAKRHLQHAEARLGDGVVGRLLVRFERDGIGEGRRHGAAVARHVADLPRSQVELRASRPSTSTAENTPVKTSE